MGIVQRTLENLVMLTDFWSGRRVLVTGHTGFKGGWLVLWLKQLGAEVAGYSLDPPTEPNLFSQAQVGEGICSLRGDVRDLDHLKRVIEQCDPEIVFHLAAQPIVFRSYAEPIETFSINLLGTVTVLESLRRAPSLKAAVIVTSDKCYENKEWVWNYRELDRLGGDDPYSCSKACAELAIAAYRTSFFNNGASAAIASARAGNVIGGGDWAADRLLPDAARAFTKNQRVLIRRPDAVRPWQHVLDALHGYLCLARALTTGDVKYRDSWNFGPRDEDVQSVRWVIDNMVAHWGDGVGWDADDKTHAHETSILKLDSAKAQSLLGWKPVMGLALAVQWTAEWYREHAMGTDAGELCRAQIARYHALRGARA